jgi:hypothetical protein
MITHLVRSRAELAPLAARLANDALRYGVLAFDAEFDRAGRVVVAQLMAHRRDVYILLVSRFEGGFPDVVRRLLEDARIVKIGHSLECDERALGFAIRGKLDVRNLMMSRGIRVPSLGARSRLKELMRMLVPEVPVVHLGGWRALTDWTRIDSRRISYLEGDVRGVYEICFRILLGDDSFVQLRRADFGADADELADRAFDQRAWLAFNVK